MKKIIKFIGIFTVIILVFMVLIFVKAAHTPVVPKGYESKVVTGENIEKTYMANGKYEVNYYEKNVDDDFKKYEVWYPKELES